MALLKEKFIIVEQDWHPCFAPLESGNPFNEEAVRVRLYTPNPSRREYLLCIWGADDFGLEMWNEDLVLLENLYDEIRNYEEISTLNAWGFEYA